MANPPNLCVFFGGFLQKESAPQSADEPLGSFYQAYPARRWLNQGEFWNGRESDILTKRWDRALTLLRSSRRPSRVSILGYSMGCHLAVRFAWACMRLRVAIDRLILLAPDPKFCETPLDRDPQGRNAYSEARTLWSVGDPGNAFVGTLRTVKARRGIVYAYSKRDTIALWRNNVEHLPRELGLDVERDGWFSKHARKKHWLIFERFRLQRLRTKMPTMASPVSPRPTNRPASAKTHRPPRAIAANTSPPNTLAHLPLEQLLGDHAFLERGAQSTRTIALYRGDSLPPAGGGGAEHRGRTFAQHFCGNGLMARFGDGGRSRDLTRRDLLQVVLEHVGYDRGQEETYRADHSPLLSFSTSPDTGMRFANRRLKALEQCHFEKATCFIWRFAPTLHASDQPGAYFFRYRADPRNCLEIVGEQVRRVLDELITGGDDLAFGQAFMQQIVLSSAAVDPKTHTAIVVDALSFLQSADLSARDQRLVDNALTRCGRDSEWLVMPADQTPGLAGPDARIWMNASLFPDGWYRRKSLPRSKPLAG
jgi:hypothetical protein